MVKIKLRTKTIAEKLTSHAKIVFRGAPKSRKRRKPRFSPERKPENGENCISPPREKQKTVKIAFLPGEKTKKR